MPPYHHSFDDDMRTMTASVTNTTMKPEKNEGYHPHTISWEIVIYGLAAERTHGNTVTLASSYCVWITRQKDDKIEVRIGTISNTILLSLDHNTFHVGVEHI